ncbi:hypothetical protein A4X06_0g4457 [Tilletia controversa]|uniref:Uncharacterized protein n=1 Tax=Tilletia controversa TaxID=13291 RepID=A0A8X7SX16_9BASI|nr:hypothetical protein CF335_g9300 [Tilletia laevis]KAE8182582.1 hypothetical protein CF328_g8461 [Tilletia controversa]KAE8247434.1 hypothetical protein A4X06_0g4457 [Tilletia controversa]
MLSRLTLALAANARLGLALAAQPSASNGTPSTKQQQQPATMKATKQNGGGRKSGKVPAVAAAAPSTQRPPPHPQPQRPSRPPGSKRTRKGAQPTQAPPPLSAREGAQPTQALPPPSPRASKMTTTTRWRGRMGLRRVLQVRTRVLQRHTCQPAVHHQLIPEDRYSYRHQLRRPRPQAPNHERRRQGPYGMVEPIHRVIPRDIVGGDVHRLRKMDAFVHVMYEIAGTAGAFTPTALISKLG